MRMLSLLLFSETFYIWSKNYTGYMQEWTNTYMIVLKTAVYLYHLYLAFSSAKIFFPTIFLKNSQTNKCKKHILFLLFVSRFLFRLLFHSCFIPSHVGNIHFWSIKEIPALEITYNSIFFFRHLQHLLHISPGGQQHSTLRRAKHLNMLAPSYMWYKHITQCGPDFSAVLRPLRAFQIETSWKHLIVTRI